MKKVSIVCVCKYQHALVYFLYIFFMFMWNRRSAVPEGNYLPFTSVLGCGEFPWGVCFPSLTTRGSLYNQQSLDASVAEVITVICDKSTWYRKCMYICSTENLESTEYSKWCNVVLQRWFIVTHSAQIISCRLWLIPDLTHFCSLEPCLPKQRITL